MVATPITAFLGHLVIPLDTDGATIRPTLVVDSLRRPSCPVPYTCAAQAANPAAWPRYDIKVGDFPGFVFPLPSGFCCWAARAFPITPIHPDFASVAAGVVE